MPEFYATDGPYAEDYIFAIPREYHDGTTWNQALAELGRASIGPVGDVTLEDVWLFKNRPFLQREVDRMYLTAERWVQQGQPQMVELPNGTFVNYGGFNRAFAEMKEALRTVDSRAGLTWAVCEQKFKATALLRERWHETRRARHKSIRARFVYLTQTSKECATYYDPRYDPAPIDGRGAWPTPKDPPNSFEFAAHPAGYGSNRNVLLTFVYPHMPDAVYQWFTPPEGEPVLQHHFNYKSCPADNKASGRSMFVQVGGGGYANGGAVHDDQRDVGEGMIGAEPGHRAEFTGIMDPAICMYGFPSRDAGAGDSHEADGHGDYVLCHSGNVTGTASNDPCPIVQEVKPWQSYPLAGDWWGPGQLWQADHWNLPKFCSVIPPIPPIEILSVNGLTVTFRCNWDPPASAGQFGVFLNGAKILTLINDGSFTVANGGDVRVDYMGAVGIDGYAGELLGTATVTVAGTVPEPEPEPVPEPVTLVSIDLKPDGQVQLARNEVRATVTEAIYSDGSRQTITPALVTSNPKRVQVSGQKIVGVSKTPGGSSVTVTASWGGRTDSVSVKVR